MILLYHNIIPDDGPPERTCVGQALTQSAFKRQIRWLAGHRPIISLAEYVAGSQEPGFMQRQPVAVTFDDGSGTTFRCIFPVFVEMNIPVTLFITTGHLEHGELLWFNYLKALCFELRYVVVKVDRQVFELTTRDQRKKAWSVLSHLAKTSGDPIQFCKALAQIYPITADVLAQYEGMTHEQIRTAGTNNLFELGAHTVTHPYLPHLLKQTREREIRDSGSNLFSLTGKPVRYFAYPGGDYDHETLTAVRTAGYEAAFAVIPKDLGNPEFEIGRIGIYSSSLLKFQLKVMGMADLARKFGMKIG